MVFIAHTLWQ